MEFIFLYRCIFLFISILSSIEQVHCIAKGRASTWTRAIIAAASWTTFFWLSYLPDFLY